MINKDYIECEKCGRLYYKYSNCLCELDSPTEQINKDEDFPHKNMRSY